MDTLRPLKCVLIRELPSFQRCPLREVGSTVVAQATAFLLLPHPPVRLCARPLALNVLQPVKNLGVAREEGCSTYALPNYWQ